MLLRRYLIALKTRNMKILGMCWNSYVIGYAKRRTHSLYKIPSPFLHRFSCAPVTPVVFDTPRSGIKMKDRTLWYRGIDTVRFVTKSVSKTMLLKAPSTSWYPDRNLVNPALSGKM